MKIETLASIRREAKKYGVNTLLTIGGNAKIVKGDKKGIYLTAIQHLAPADESGYNTCPFASPGCKAACLYASGRAELFPMIKEVRIARTKLFFEHRALYKNLLYAEIDAFIRKAKRKGVKPAIRLNGTSDIVWERVFPDMFVKYSQVVFYDYTKIAARFRNNNAIAWNKPKNYYLLFSRSEINDKQVDKVLKWGGNVAVVFNTLPNKYKSKKVINGDETDIRFQDKKGVIVGLKAKGKAKKDSSGFVVQV